MLISFNIQKAIQASVVLLKAEPTRRMGRLRLLKLLYIADREAIQERARPITGDYPVAMDHGPVLSRIYDLIKGSDFQTPQWEHFLLSVGREVALQADPGVGDLSKYEIEKLHAVSARFVEWDDWAVAEYTHGYQEYLRNEPPKGKVKAIPVDDLLNAAGRANLKEAIAAQKHAEAIADHFLCG